MSENTEAKKEIRWVLALFAVVLVIGFLEIRAMSKDMDKAKADCIAHGGENVNVGRGFICLKKGTALEPTR